MRDNGFIRLISKTTDELCVCWNAYSLKQVSLLTLINWIIFIWCRGSMSSFCQRLLFQRLLWVILPGSQFVRGVQATNKMANVFTWPFSKKLPNLQRLSAPLCCGGWIKEIGFQKLKIGLYVCTQQSIRPNAMQCVLRLQKQSFTTVMLRLFVWSPKVEETALMSSAQAVCAWSQNWTKIRNHVVTANSWSNTLSSTMFLKINLWSMRTPDQMMRTQTKNPVT